MRLNEDPADYRKDLSVAEGAVVKVTARGGAARERKTEAFSRAGITRRPSPFHGGFRGGPGRHLRHHHDVQGRNGHPHRGLSPAASWKTHFYFHSTTGTLSPASILRFGEDATTKLRCHVYAVYPLESYHKLGGRQLR